MNKYLYSVIGGILGIPVSFFFLDEFTQFMIGSAYHYSTHISRYYKYKDIKPALFFTIMGMAIVGLLIGNYSEKNARKT